MKFNDFIVSEEKVRLDPKCWTGKKIGNPKTKVKGGVRVNNCVPAESVEEDISRRGFLKGAGAAAVAGAAGGAKAEQLNVEPLMTSTDGSVSIVFVSRPGKAVNGWLALKKRNGQWSPQTNDPAGGIKIDGNKVITVGFDFVNTNPRIGRDEAGAPDYSLANMNGIDYIHPIKSASKQILMNLKQIGGGIVEFNPRSTKESVNQGVAEAANPAQQAAIAIAKKKKAGVDEAAPPGAKAERMVKHIKKGYAKDGKLSDKEKSIAYATAWKAHNKGVTEGTQRVDSLVTDALKIMRGSEVSDAVAALKTVLGDREYNSRRGYYNFYVRQLLDMSGQQGMTEGAEADVKVYQNKMTGKFIAWMDHRGKREQAEGDTKQEAVTELMQKIDVNDSTRMSRAAETANQMKRFVLSGPFVRGTLGKQSKDPFFIKLDNQTLYVSDSPAAGFIRVKHDPSSQWNFMGDASGKLAMDAGIIPGNRYTISPNTSTDPRLPQSFKLSPHSEITGSNDKVRYNAPMLVIQHTGRGRMTEEFNGEYDDEAGMAQGNLYTIAQAAQGLLDTIDDNDNLPEWAQEKIAKVEGMLVAVWNYLQSQKAQGMDPKVDEGEVKPFVIPDDQTQGNYENQGYRKNPQDQFAVIDYTFNKVILTTNDIKQAKQEAIEWAEYDDIPVAVKNQQTNKVVFKLNGYADAEKYLDESSDPEIAEMYEAMQHLVTEMAQKNNVSEDAVWEQFEAMPDNMLYETAAWRRKEGKSKKGGLNAKGVASYRRENPGSKLQTAVTTKPSKLKPGSKAAKRRKSFCARMGGVKGPMKKPNGKPTRKALALRKWNC